MFLYAHFFALPLEFVFYLDDEVIARFPLVVSSYIGTFSKSFISL